MRCPIQYHAQVSKAEVSNRFEYMARSYPSTYVTSWCLLWSQCHSVWAFDRCLNHRVMFDIIVEIVATLVAAISHACAIASLCCKYYWTAVSHRHVRSVDLLPIQLERAGISDTLPRSVAIDWHSVTSKRCSIAPLCFSHFNWPCCYAPTHANE